MHYFMSVRAVRRQRRAIVKSIIAAGSSQGALGAEELAKSIRGRGARKEH